MRNTDFILQYLCSNVSVVSYKFFDLCNFFLCHCFARTSRTRPVINLRFPIFELSNPTSNCAERQCMFPLCINQSFMDFGCIAAIFPRNENVVSLVLLTHFWSIVLVRWGKESISRQRVNESGHLSFSLFLETMRIFHFGLRLIFAEMQPHVQDFSTPPRNLSLEASDINLIYKSNKKQRNCKK